MRLYVIVVSKGGNLKPEVLTDAAGRPLAFATRAKATAARVEIANGSDKLLNTWKIVPFVKEPSESKEPSA